MCKILLDPKICLKSKSGFTTISSEVDFLNHFDKPTNLLIQGERLCKWAEIFYMGRKREVSTYTSVSEELTNLIPLLSATDAKKIEVEILAKNIELEYNLSVKNLLNMLFPKTIWSTLPSWTHFAEWLTWLITEKPANHYYALLKVQMNFWFANADDDLKKLYQILDYDEAYSVLRGWLRIEENDWSDIKEKFPIVVHEEFIQSAREQWIPEIIFSDGQFINRLDKSQTPYTLLSLAAKETFNFLKAHPGKITQSHYAQLSEYLDPSDCAWLSKIRKPKTPSGLPNSPKNIIKWFIEEYLPFREWQHITKSKDEKTMVLDYAKQFSLWYLEEYPKGIIDGPISEFISFRCVRKLSPQNNEIIIVIVMDGLHCIDARTLKQLLLPKIPEYKVVETNYVFSAIPTITEDSKEALLRGVPPENIEQVGFAGEVVSMNSSLAERVRLVSPPIILFWRLIEPDSTYHRINRSETLKFDVKGSLSSATDKIQEIIQSVPDTVKLKLIITTDHGRMLGESKYCIPNPDGFESHGRVAKGEVKEKFPSQGVLIKDDVALLYKESFGTNKDLAIALSEDAFQTTNKSKKRELYSHGGLFPEEVIIPWYVFMKPEEKPEVSIEFTGKGQVRKKATAAFVITNSSSSRIFLEKIIIDSQTIGRIEREYNLDISPLSWKKIEVELMSWPTQKEKKEMLAIAIIRSTYGISYEMDINKVYESEEMYSATDIFEELQ